MLELLAGPFTVLDDGFDPVEVSGGLGLPGFFVDGRGVYCTEAYLPATPADTMMGWLSWDGHFHQNGRPPQTSGMVYDVQSRKILAFEPATINNAIPSFPLNPKNGHRFDPETGSVYEVVRTIQGTGPGLFALADRWLNLYTVNQFTFQTGIEGSTDGCQTWASEYVLPGLPHVVSSHATAAGLICLARTDGSISFYDPAVKQVTKTVYIDSAIPGFVGGYYSDKHGVYLTVHTTGGNGLPAGCQTRVWASTPQPAALAAPVAQSPLLRGQVTVFQTQLTGSNGEPCPAELIDWALTGNGTLLDQQSTTDAYGNATARYAAPLDSLPFVSISATARF